MSESIRVGVLTVSDTASKDETADKSGPALVTLLQEAGLSCPSRQIIPDEVQRIQHFVKLWSDAGLVDFIITTGGTGFGVRDRTPEAIAPLIEREAPGLVHLLLSASLKHTPLAALSRPVAGTIKNTLVVTLPGSTKAVTENFQALLQGGVLKHAIELIRGGTGQQVHSQFGASHHHHHDHNHHGHRIPQPRTNITHDPSASVSMRHRISPFPLISFEDAMDMIMTTVKPLEEKVLPVTPALVGHVLAQDVYASRDVPATPATNVDGYAVICDAIDANGTYTVTTPQRSKSLLPGTICRVNTGAPLPAGADALLTTDEDGEEVEIRLLAKVDKGENVRAAGSDVKTGDLALQKGERILSPGGEIGTLVFVGCKEVRVHRKPIVGILSTGNELLDLQAPIPLSEGSSWGGIWDTNRPSLQAALQGLGYDVVDLGIVSDEVPAHVEAIKKGLDSTDILITTGGTSMGPTDLLKPVIERHFSGTIHFGRVTIKPGKPTTFATIPWTGNVVKPVFALPGNPSSALVTFHIFVVPALRKLGGWPQGMCQLPRAKVELQSSMNLDPRMEFHRVIICAGERGLKAFSTGGQRSSRVASMSGANGLVVLSQRKPGGPQRLEAGELVDAVLIGELQAVV
ncbi:MoaB/Mog domain-containing protein [Armillaria novae-zelandiae]|uniref:MoaB/Mog domain-containing protein n=1 Tax=Armillaria novae-zelandiae TaxID=153914 RepID=A0AA39USX6_9AGAR|nr:MoaB/Mog domain-containing protein [Armillaria novae-zelandiae]